MTDPYLYELMHQKVLIEGEQDQDTYADAYENEIHKIVDEIVNDQQNPGLLPSDVYRTKVEKEIRDLTCTADFGDRIQLSIDIIRKEGAEYLDGEAFSALIENLDLIAKNFQELDSENINDESLANSLEVTPSNSSSILKIGIEKFQTGLFLDSLAIFTFLTLLNPDDPDYWFKYGITAAHEGKYELALKAYEASSSFAPEFIGPYLFSAECCLALGQRDSAQQFLNKIKTLNELNSSEWQEYIDKIEKQLIETPEVKEK